MHISQYSVPMALPGFLFGADRFYYFFTVLGAHFGWIVSSVLDGSSLVSADLGQANLLIEQVIYQRDVQWFPARKRWPHFIGHLFSTIHQFVHSPPSSLAQ